MAWVILFTPAWRPSRSPRLRAQGECTAGVATLNRPQCLFLTRLPSALLLCWQCGRREHIPRPQPRWIGPHIQACPVCRDAKCGFGETETAASQRCLKVTADTGWGFLRDSHSSASRTSLQRRQYFNPGAAALQNLMAMNFGGHKVGLASLYISWGASVRQAAPQKSACRDT